MLGFAFTAECWVRGAVFHKGWEKFVRGFVNASTVNKNYMNYLPNTDKYPNTIGKSTSHQQSNKWKKNSKKIRKNILKIYWWLYWQRTKNRHANVCNAVTMYRALVTDAGVLKVKLLTYKCILSERCFHHLFMNEAILLIIWK